MVPGVAGPLVSVVTPTWQRRDQVLNRCIPSVLAQTWAHVEHIVVSDGPDPDLETQAGSVASDRVRFSFLPEHDPQARWGHWARLAGIDLAKGDFIAYLDDDNAFRPNHLEAVVTAMEETGADFGYGIALFQGRGEPYPVGAQRPSYGQIDTSVIVHRRELLERGTWEPSLPTIDWDLVERWLAAGATWAFVPYVTVDYYFS
jgi:glycosyltransferase involved in cell wall biosynthesis